jgi:hypothetical protein
MPEVVAAAPEAVVPEVAMVPEVPEMPEVEAEQVVDADHEDEASSSNITANVDDLLPPPPAFVVPPMEWLLGGPSAGWLIDDPERDFSDEECEALPPLLYYQRHGFGPCLPSPMPSGEDQAHFAPPGYDPLPEMEEEDTAQSAVLPMPSPEAAAAHVVSGLPDLNLPALDEKEKAEDTAPSTALPTPSPEARLLLRRFAAAMAARPAGIRAGTWSPVKLGLADREGGLRLDEPSAGTSRR